MPETYEDPGRSPIPPGSPTPRALPLKRRIGLVGGPALALILLYCPAPAEMPPEAWRMVALAAWMVIWWLTEAIAIAATALLPLVLMPLLGIADMNSTAASYADPLIFLFLGGFLIAAAMQRVGLHRRIALKIITLVGGTPARIVLGFMIATGFLSMWISNTAATIMMYAVGLSVIDFLRRNTDDAGAVRRFGVALMLGIAYSASIGGVGTLIGTPPNALLASFLRSAHGIEITFLDWMKLGLPVVAVMLPAAWLLLTRILFPAGRIAVGNPGTIVAGELRALGPMDAGERLVGVVFACAALGWIFRAPLAGATGLPLNDTIVALTAALALFAIPIPSAQGGSFALDWQATRALPWDVLILFGGGLALAGGFGSSGLAEWIGAAVGGFRIGTAALVLAVTVAIVYLTEITSNTASTATFLPVLAAIAVGMGLNPLVLTVPVALGASMAFMMPVATPPNAIVFGYEEMRMGDMVRAGFALNIIGILVTFAIFTLLGPMIFGISF
ncbi:MULTISPECIES: SLC13 family permease [Actibacterium]|uniref:Sodium-dependent dicarboxylate transporter 2/3/5 n=1 Tax=Actibacterium naphthalenivorans TaxID=1614693 RepID=A0A840CPJ6_9RHOB|nr:MULTISPECIES: DASS family sodium-coupled anion symporter [Actibacterium]MBB4023867.1 sodium-dependent dicarboxylate transporter 2/3/5 [Actibacterium naphthalenivorans]